MVNLNSKRGAIISPDGHYRYLLWRNWDLSRPRLLWVMLNPSTADATRDDPTLRRCISFTKAWGYGAPFSHVEGFGGLEVVNLFAYRATDPMKLHEVADPVGAANDWYLMNAARRASAIVVAWGGCGPYEGRDRTVLGLLARHAACPPLCLDTLLNGCPRHPLYVDSGTLPQPYRRLAAIA